jgi:hypothetical protein
MDQEKNPVILSFDVGIIHLAYCLFTKKNNNWFILEWNNIDLTDRNQTKCHCGLKASFTYNSNYYCKVHSKKCEPIKLFNDLFIENKLTNNKCQCLVKENICGKKCSFNDENKIFYCTTHAKSKYKNLSNQYKVKPYKNSSIAELDFDKTQIKLFEILDSKKELLNADIVLIENQPSFKNPRMKSISIALYSYFLLRGILDKNITKSNINKVKFMSPSNKIKVVNDEETKTLTLLKDNETKLYKLTKELGIKYCKMMINHLPEWLEFLEKQKKKDDLADAFLQGAYYFEKN